jgi:hypothetical protein
MVQTLGFLIVRRLLGAVGLGAAPDARDVEIAVLRHQLSVLARQVTRRSPVRGSRDANSWTDSAGEAGRRERAIGWAMGRTVEAQL